MVKPYTTFLGKTVRYIARLRGGGSALPGLFVETIDPHFVRDTLATLPEGVVVISGTNGKTTTTKMVVALLEGQGYKVFTNRTGSNFTRGVAAALLGDIDKRGKLYADIAVLELDEAHAVHFVQAVAPRYSLLLNVMRDQLDRFGEIDHTASMLRIIAEATTEAVVLNREDPRIVAIGSELPEEKTRYFGLASDLRPQFPSDDELHGIAVERAERAPADVILKNFDDHQATFTFLGKDFSTGLQLTGIYNIYNAAAALTLTNIIAKDKLDKKKLIADLANVAPAFGRGEVLVVNGHPLELVLVKNPSGFRLGLQSYNPEGYATMIAINDNYADGRDMSWLWDVNFSSLQAGGVAEIGGIRAYDMALRMQYDEIDVSHVEIDLPAALRHFLGANMELPKRIYCTYTAMLQLRRELSKMTNVEQVS